MRGRIIFSNGYSASFTDGNYEEVISDLTEDQKASLARILRDRLGPRDELPFDPEVYAAWYEDVHRKDIILGGGSSNSDGSKINPKGGKKYSLKDWKDKGNSERNVCWLRNTGFKKTWKDTTGYQYIKKHRDGYTVAIPIEWLAELDHEMFKLKVNLLTKEV